MICTSAWMSPSIKAFTAAICTAVSKRVDTAMGLGVAVVVIQAITVPANGVLQAGAGNAHVPDRAGRWRSGWRIDRHGHLEGVA